MTNPSGGRNAILTQGIQRVLEKIPLTLGLDHFCKPL